jgi:hypothetical protein
MDMRGIIDVVETSSKIRRVSSKLKDGTPVVLDAQPWKADESRFPDDDSTVILIRATVNRVVVGFAEFYCSGETSGNVEDVQVEKAWRRLGVATKMYDFLKVLGYRVEPSNNRIEPDGRAFWNARQRRK